MLSAQAFPKLATARDNGERRRSDTLKNPRVVACRDDGDLPADDVAVAALAGIRSAAVGEFEQGWFPLAHMFASLLAASGPSTRALRSPIAGYAPAASRVVAPARQALPEPPLEAER